MRQLRRRLRTAIGQTIGVDRVPDEPRRFKPHISVAYCNNDVPAAELIDRVAGLRRRSPLNIRVNSAHLIELRREGHTYRWNARESVGLR